jgi:hypothetical protein
MANARTRYDTICDYLVRHHEARLGQLYGKPCALIQGHAFMVFCFDGTAFRLNGRLRLQASALPGARYWDPLGRKTPSMDWVHVPEAHFLRWDRFAIEAAKIAKQGFGPSNLGRPRVGEQSPPLADPAERSIRRLAPSFSLSRLWSLVPLVGK